MVSDVMNELYSSGSIEGHDYEAITPADLVRLVLKQKDKQIHMLKVGMIAFGAEQIKIKPILDPELVYKLVDDIFIIHKGCAIEGECLFQTLVDLGLLRKETLGYFYSLKNITKKLQGKGEI